MENQRREFLKNLTLGGFGAAVAPNDLFTEEKINPKISSRSLIDKPYEKKFNTSYEGSFLNRVAFPIGGIGTGMFCIEGTGAISHMSIRHRPEIFHEPGMFAAVTIRGAQTKAKLLEGPVPEWKLFGQKGTGNGAAGTTFGLPRFKNASFKTRFPFADITLDDPKFPLKVNITGWNPFIPTDQDNSSLPVGGIEYSFTNTSTAAVDAIFSFNTKNFLAQENTPHSIKAIKNGFLLHQPPAADKPFLAAQMAYFTDINDTKVDHCWFRGGWWDPLTMAWNAVKEGNIDTNDPVEPKSCRL